jgi:hypothetical protein
MGESLPDDWLAYWDGALLWRLCGGRD